VINTIAATNETLFLKPATPPKPGDRVITLASWTAVSRHTKRAVPVRMVEVVTVRDGRITELRAYYEDTVPLIEAADGVKGRYNPGVG